MITPQKTLGRVGLEVEHSPVLPEPINHELKEWDRFMESLLSPGQEDKLRSLNSYTDRILGQFRLNDTYKADEIIHEAYITGKKKITSGEKIYNCMAWFKKTITFIIRNLQRKEASRAKTFQKLQNIDELLDYSQESTSQELANEQVDLLSSCWNCLSELERRILVFREVEGLSWEKIGEALVSTGDEKDDINLTTRVRKKGNRALAKIRNLYKQKS